MVNKKFIVIAIDGGAASGKSSTSKILAERLNLLYVDTGAHYRTIAYMLLSNNIYPENLDLIINQLLNFKLTTNLIGRSAQLALNDQYIDDDHLRSELVNRYVSQFATLPEIRDFLLKYQRSLKDFGFNNQFAGLVMEGRDIGSIVLPDADFCFFLEADPNDRHERRKLQGQQDLIHARDQLDLTRKTAPMICPPNAIRINSSKLSLEEVVNFILKIIAS